MPVLSSASGVLSLLKEDDPALQAYAVDGLLQAADVYWNEISDALGMIEEMYEDEAFPERRKAALLLSKVYYHLGEYKDALVYALGAGDMFDVNKRDQYTFTVIRKCIDRYTVLRQMKPEEGKADPQYAQLDVLFENLVTSWSKDDSNWAFTKELVGLCLEARRLDLLDKIVKDYVRSTLNADMLSHVLHLANVHVDDVDLREKVLRSVVQMYAESPEKLRSVNYFDMQQCLIFLNDNKEVTRILCSLLDDKSAAGELTAYQLAFDLFDHCNQDFLLAVMDGIREHLQVQNKPGESEEKKEEGEGEESQSKKKAKMEVPDTYRKLCTILTGVPTTEIQFQFLVSKNRAEVETMEKIKKASETPKSSITCNAAMMANAIMFCGTLKDKFLRDYIDWNRNWARFSATASLGVINKGHVSQSMEVLQPYLPSSPSAGGASPYQEGGALFGLGLIHAPVGCNQRDNTAELISSNSEADAKSANYPREVLNFLLQCLQANQQSEQIAHGSCLGIGLASMASKDEDIYELLKQVLSNNSAVSGESAAVAVGLVYLGSGDERAVDELLSYGRETQHEKIIRGVSQSLAMIMYGREGHADVLIDDLLLSTDPWLRLGGCQVIGLAYSGTGNRKALERLLNVAVQDTSDDVRRAAIMEIGFVTFKDPQLCVQITSLFADSYSPHIRYGVAAALGVCAAGTGNKAAVERLWALKDDTVDFVRQGAIVSLAMVLMQKTEKENPRVKELKEDLQKRIKDRWEDILTKFGSILALGILDAGGRNQTILLQKNGHNLVKPIIGLHTFMQFWYWYPYILFFSLALQPTSIIALNKDLKMPKFKLRSNAPPSQYGVPKSEEGSNEKEKKKREKVVLSTTTKTEKRKKRKGQEGADKMDTDVPPTPATSTLDVKEKESKDKDKDKDKD
eukprot:Sspe_Gene.18578::Locus_6687_Transcript_1_1_Confidence_1.000_Length_2811::g.18578::m.18578/K03032/PSMD1, RPN2; 26S proteasome regulatory subunit N2